VEETGWGCDLLAQLGQQSHDEVLLWECGRLRLCSIQNRKSKIAN